MYSPKERVSGYHIVTWFELETGPPKGKSFQGFIDILIINIQFVALEARFGCALSSSSLFLLLLLLLLLLISSSRNRKVVVMV